MSIDSTQSNLDAESIMSENESYKQYYFLLLNHVQPLFFEFV